MKSSMQYLQKHKELIFKVSLFFFVILFCLFFFYWGSQRTEIISDDWTYFHNNFNVDLLIARFITWSQRIVIEIPMFAILRAPYILNIVFCALLYPIFAIALAKLLKLSVLKSFLIALPFAAFQNISENEGAGVVTTHFNYLLPLITAMWSVVILRSNKVGVIKGCLLLLFAIFSTSNEMLAVAFMLMLPFLFFYDRKHKNWYITVISISALHLGLLFLSGASTVRVCTDGITQYPDFNKLSLIYKIYQGTVATVFYYTTNLNFYSIFLVFSVCYCFFKYQAKAFKNSVVIAVITAILLYIYGCINITHSSQIYNYPLSYMVEITTNKACALMCLSVIAISVLLYMILKLNCNYQIKIIVLSLLVAAFAIRMTLAFSPTVFFSRTRTFFISNLLILLASCYLLIRFDLFSKLQVKALILILGASSISYQMLTMTPKIRLPLTYTSSYTYQFAKCSLKYKIPEKYVEEITYLDLPGAKQRVYSSITPYNAYTSLREKHVLKSGKLPLLRNYFYNNDESRKYILLVSNEVLYRDYIKNKGMEPYDGIIGDLVIYPNTIKVIDNNINITK